MDFFGTVILLVVYLLHPQDWFGLEWLRPAALATLMGIVGLLHRKQGHFFSELLRTPHDWLMLCYFGWILYASASWRDGFDYVFNSILFYILIANSASNFNRIKLFIRVWIWSLFIIAFLAVASEFGIDPFDTYVRTHEMWKGRLVLHLANYHNPNALGHSIAPVAAVLYLLYFWKRPIFVKELTLVLLVIPLYCVYLTESKGAYVTGFIAVVVGFTFGRPKAVQIVILVAALTIGWTAMLMLPRMKEMQNPHTEAGIQGRLEVFTFGLKMVKELPYGVGIGQFERAFSQEPGGSDRSAHSSYVAIGAELGWRGMFFYLALFYCSLRVLVTAKTSNIEEERVRRILTVMISAFMVSGWLIYWPYSGAYFMLAAITAAFHRYLLDQQRQESPGVETVPQTAAIPAFAAQPAAALQTPPPAWSQMGKISPEMMNTPVASGDKSGLEAAPVAAIKWRRFGIIDLLLVWLITELVIRFWTYIVRSM